MGTVLHKYLTTPESTVPLNRVSTKIHKMNKHLSFTDDLAEAESAQWLEPNIP